MNGRILLLVALIVAGVAVWFYQKQDSTTPTINIKTSELDYEATNIQAVQTNEQGETEYQLDAKSLSFNPTTNQDEMSEVTMTWQPVTDQHYRIKAGIAAINQQTGDMRLTDGFVLIGNPSTTESASDEPSANQAAMTANQDSLVQSSDVTGSSDVAISDIATADRGSIIIRGQTLKGNTKQQSVYSDEPVTVEQGSNRFKADSMQVNLQTGDYEFGQVAVTYTPAPRQDEALF